jgi:hypothetical protein
MWKFLFLQRLPRTGIYVGFISVASVGRNCSDTLCCNAGYGQPVFGFSVIDMVPEFNTWRGWPEAS